MTIKNYDPKKVSIIIGSTPIGGFANGTFAKIGRDEDAFSLVVGADGETTRVRNANIAGKLTITLQASSASNDYLTALAVADETGPAAGTATFALLVKDNMGTSLYGAATAWIAKTPEAEFGKETTAREWVIQTDELAVYTGGINLT